eukprot:g1520.t1
MGRIEKKRNSIQRRLQFLNDEKKKVLSLRKFQEEDHGNKTPLNKSVKTSLKKTKTKVTKIEKLENNKNRKRAKKRNRSNKEALLREEKVGFMERAYQPPVLDFKKSAKH